MKESKKKVLQEQRTILQQNGLEKEFRRLQRKFKKLNMEVVLLKDSCKEFYDGDLYVAQIFRTRCDKELTLSNLDFVIVKPSVDLVLREMEDYFNEE